MSNSPEKDPILNWLLYRHQKQSSFATWKAVKGGTPEQKREFVQKQIDEMKQLGIEDQNLNNLVQRIEQEKSQIQAKVSEMEKQDTGDFTEKKLATEEDSLGEELKMPTLLNSLLEEDQKYHPEPRKIQENKPTERLTKHKSRNLSEKTCVICGRPFSWRKKWERAWEEVDTCSKRCRTEKKNARQREKKLGEAEAMGGDGLEEHLSDKSGRTQEDSWKNHKETASQVLEKAAQTQNQHPSASAALPR